jgi:alanine racemase
VEVDTGMGRSGFDWRTVGEWSPAVVALTGGALRLEGVFTHFHSADVSGESIEEQAGRFRDTVRVLAEAVGDSGDPSKWILHLANSAASLRAPETAADLVRPGIFLYGGAAGEGLPAPAEVVSVKARIVRLREVPPGTSVGYGATYRSTRTERWATVGIGYGDGLPRSLGNRGHALVEGRRVPIIGRISMDLTVVDTTDIDRPGPEVGSEVTFVGSQGTERISLEEVADLAGTLGYEILTGLTPRLPRIWIPEYEGEV